MREKFENNCAINCSYFCQLFRKMYIVDITLHEKMTLAILNVHPETNSVSYVLILGNCPFIKM